MIHEVDDALRRLVEASLGNGAKIGVSFDAPTKDWAARQNTPTVNLFLHDVREDGERRAIQPMPVYDEHHRIVDRRTPPRWFRLSYLATVWTQRAEDEHRLLSRLMATFVPIDALPPDVIAEDSSLAPYVVRCELAGSATGDRSTMDLWSAFGGEFRASLGLTVTAPFDAGITFETGPPVREEPRVQVLDVPSSTIRTRARPGSRS